MTPRPKQLLKNQELRKTPTGITGQPPVIDISSKRIHEKFFDSAEDRNGPYCHISIKDNGIGFNQRYAKNVFYLFED